VELEGEQHLKRGQWVRVGSVTGQVLAVDDEYDVVEIQPLRSNGIMFAPQVAVEPVDIDAEFFVLSHSYWQTPKQPPSDQAFVVTLSMLAFYSGLSTMLTLGRAVIRKVFSILD